MLEHLARQPTPTPQSTSQLAELTPRELQVLELIARGQSNREIAATLVIEESTVKTHVKRILLKLDLRDRIHAVIFAYETGLAQHRPAIRGLTIAIIQSRRDPGMPRADTSFEPPSSPSSSRVITPVWATLEHSRPA